MTDSSLAKLPKLREMAQRVTPCPRRKWKATTTTYLVSYAADYPDISPKELELYKVK